MLLHIAGRMIDVVSVRLLVVLMFALFLAGSGPALARHEGASCGLPVPEDPFGHEEFIDIGHRFLVRNVRITPHSRGVVVAGEIHNDRQGFFTPPLFKARLFDPACTYLGANNFSIDHFEFGTTRPFRVNVPRVQFADVATYHIEFLP